MKQARTLPQCHHQRHYSKNRLCTTAAAVAAATTTAAAALNSSSSLFTTQCLPRRPFNTRRLVPGLRQSLYSSERL